MYPITFFVKQIHSFAHNRSIPEGPSVTEPSTSTVQSVLQKKTSYHNVADKVTRKPSVAIKHNLAQ